MKIIVLTSIFLRASNSILKGEKNKKKCHFIFYFPHIKKMSLRKVIAINAGRKTFNTVKVLKAALEGAKAKGAETELIHLQDYVYTGCKGCMACKMKKNTPPKMCLQKDQLNPVLEKAVNADGLIIGAPIYMMQPNGYFRCFSERFCYPYSRYGTKETYYPNKKQKAALIFTMGLSQKEYPIVKPGIEIWKHSYQSLIPKYALARNRHYRPEHTEQPRPVRPA